MPRLLHLIANTYVDNMPSKALDWAAMQGPRQLRDSPSDSKVADPTATRDLDPGKPHVLSFVWKPVLHSLPPRLLTATRSCTHGSSTTPSGPPHYVRASAAIMASDLQAVQGIPTDPDLRATSKSRLCIQLLTEGIASGYQHEATPTIDLPLGCRLTHTRT